MRLIVLRASLLLVLLVLVGCGARTHASARSASSPGSAATAAPASSTAAETASTSTTTTEHAVPPGFVPLSFTAVSGRDFWVLGSVLCRRGRCTAIVRSSDGGASFTRTAAPELQRLGLPGVTPALRFADREDGWAFVTGSGGAAYATHDGASTWHRLDLGSLIAFASGGGYTYAVSGDCSRSGCSGYRFRRSPVSRDDWSASPMPFTPDGPVLDLAAHGSDVWLLGTRAGDVSGPHDLLARSSDAGATFTVGDGPCFAGLGGGVEPTSPTVLWAVCPTGMLAAAFRSIDGGNTFAPLHTPPLVNSAQLAPASDTTALLVPNGAATQPLLTTDAGASWSPTQTPAGANFWPWVSFTDATVGAALVQTHWDAAAQVELQQLWHTTDGGASWHDVRIH